MAARDEVIRFVLQTAGGDAVASLVKQIDALGAAGEASAAQVDKLLDEFAAARQAESAAADYQRLTASLAALGESADAAGLKLKIATQAEASAAADFAAKSASVDAARQALAAYADASDRTAQGERELRDAVRSATVEQRAAKSAWTDAATAAKDAGAAFERIGTEQDQLGAKLASLKTTLAAANVSTTDLAGAQATLGARAATAQSALANLARTLATEQSAADAAAQAAQRINEAHQTLGTRPFAAIEADIAKVREAYRTLAESGTLSTQALAQANVKMEAQIKSLRNETSGWTQSLGDMKVKVAATAAGLLGFANVLENAAKTSADFEQAMAAVSTLLDDSSGLDHLTDSVRELSREFGTDLLTNAKGLYGILSAGISNSAQAMDVLRVANQLALGGMTDVDTAARGVVATLNAYGLSAEHAAEVSDAFFTASKVGATSIEALAGSIGQVAPVAASVGVSLDQLLAALATLTNTGIDTAEAATQIKAALTAVISPGDEARKTAAGLGLEFSLAALKAKGFSGFLQDVASKTKGNQEALGALFGNVRALQGVLALAGNQAAGFASALGEMANKAGATQTAVNTMADTAAQRFATFEAQAQQLKESLGATVVEGLTPALDAISRLLQAFNLLPESTRSSVTAITLMLGAFGAVSAVLGTIGGPLKVFTAGIVEAFGALGQLATGAGGASRAIDGIRAASARIPKPVGILAIGAASVDTASKLIELYDRLVELHDVGEMAAQGQQDLADSQARLQAKAANLVSTLKTYADTQILAADAVSQLGAAEAERYRQSLVDAGRYYEAVRIQARAVGDAQAEAFAADKVHAYRAAVADLTPVMQQLADAASQADKAIGFEGAKTFIADLDKLRATGLSAAAALDGVFKDRNFAQINEPAILGRALGELRGQAADTAAIFDGQLTAALVKLDGQTLQAFQQNAEAALEAGKINALELTDLLNSSLQAALQKLGVNAAAAGATITSTGAEIIATFQAVTQNAQATADTIGAAFDAALGSAKTVDEAKALGAALQAAMDQGRIGAEAAAQKMQELQDRLLAIKAEADPLAESFKTLGIKSEAALQAAAAAARTAFNAIVDGAREGTAAQEDVRAAFVAYAQAQLAAAANSTAITKEQIEEQLRLQAAALGLTDLLQKAGLAGEDAGNKTADSFSRAADSMDRAGDSAKKLSDSTSNVAQGFDALAASARGVSAASNDAGVAIGFMTQAAADQIKGITAVNGLNAAFLRYSDQIFATSQALDAFIAKQQKAAEVARQAAQEIADAQQALLEAQGDQGAIEDQRHKQRLDDLKTEFQTNGTLTRAQYQQLVDLENKLHALKLQHIDDEATASGDATPSRSNGGGLNNPAPPAPPAPESPGPAPAPDNVVPLRPQAATINIEIPVSGSIIGGTPSQLAEALARLIQPQLDRLTRLRG